MDSNKTSRSSLNTSRTLSQGTMTCSLRWPPNFQYEIALFSTFQTHCALKVLTLLDVVKLTEIQVFLLRISPKIRNASGRDLPPGPVRSHCLSNGHWQLLSFSQYLPYHISVSSACNRPHKAFEIGNPCSCEWSQHETQILSGKFESQELHQGSIIGS